MIRLPQVEEAIGGSGEVKQHASLSDLQLHIWGRKLGLLLFAKLHLDRLRRYCTFTIHTQQNVLFYIYKKKTHVQICVIWLRINGMYGRVQILLESPGPEQM